MNKFAIFALAWVFAVALMAHAADKKIEVFEGEVSDSQCAFNVHSLTRSHREMLKNKTHGSTPAECVMYCIRYGGGHFVLVDKKNVYRLDDEGSVKDYSAKKVKITGTYDNTSNTIHVLEVKPL